FDSFSFLPGSVGQDAAGITGPGSASTAAVSSLDLLPADDTARFGSSFSAPSSLPPSGTSNGPGQPAAAGNTNQDGIPNGILPSVATRAAATGAGSGTLAADHPLADVQAVAAPLPGPDQPALPYGLFAFTVRDVQPGGSASVRMVLPDDARP